MTDSENIVDLEKLKAEIERARQLFSDPKTVKERKKRTEERFRKGYLVRKKYYIQW